MVENQAAEFLGMHCLSLAFSRERADFLTKFKGPLSTHNTFA